MSDHLKKLEALRCRKSAAHLNEPGQEYASEDTMSKWNSSRSRMRKLFLSLFCFSWKEWKRQRKLLAEHKAAEFEENLKLECELREIENTFRLKLAKKEAEKDQLERDMREQAEVAEFLAKTKHRAVAEAMHYGKVISVYATKLIRFIDSSEIDPETANYFKNMVRRLVHNVMVDNESASLDVDFDQ